jgi:hypothetical protein
VTYRATADSSTQTPEERKREAIRILIVMKLIDKVASMSPSESGFVQKMQEHVNNPGMAVTTKQLWWLRDLHERYNL